VTSLYAADSAPPKVSILGDNPAYVSESLWGAYRDQEASCSDGFEGNLGLKKGNLAAIDMKVPGTYRLPYTCQNARGVIGYAHRMVIVEEANGENVC
jgi:hypothetical protein